MPVLIPEFALGALIVFLALRDVVGTAVVAGRTPGPLQIVRRIVLVLLPLWRRTRRREDGLATAFAPTVMVLAFLAWILLLILGFGLMTHALSAAFDPVLPGFSQALFVAGSGLATVGLSETDATGLARWVVMSAGFCGLAVMTLAITYLLMVQGAVAGRDAGILKLTTSAGAPPSGLALLERYAALGMTDQLPQLLHDARDWCAAVLQSHASHPSLIYFRSAGAGSGWPAAIGALMDLALIAEVLIDDAALRGPAALLREEGLRMIATLSALIRLDPVAIRLELAEVGRLTRRLEAAGFSLREDADTVAFLSDRNRHAGGVRALAAHLGSAEAPLVPGHG